VLLWVVVTRIQLTKLLTKLLIERNQGRTISMCAMKAGMSRKTAGKCLRQDNVMEQRPVPHTWRTREDPLREIRPMALERLRGAPELEAKTLFEHLAQDHGEAITPGLLRTFQIGHACLAYLPTFRIKFIAPGKDVRIDHRSTAQSLHHRPRHSGSKGQTIYSLTS